jgi:broad specificity phosphatase PhoE
MKVKEFVIFRHASKSSWSNDPELSEQGHQQAQLIVEKIKAGVLPQPRLLLCSPKIRAQQTFLPIKNAFRVPFETDPFLDERNQSETGASFECRVKNFLEEHLHDHTYSTIYICTHLDWIEVFSWAAPLNVDITSEVLHLPSGHFYHVQIDSEEGTFWKLVNKGGME